MKGGFTLIEMTVVLAIIAIVTHLALRQLDGVREERMVREADRQLGEIRDGVHSLDRDGVPVGFLADMGRLAMATNGTLSELWECPAGARRYAVRRAIRENLFKGAPSALVRTNVCVGTGWRGPYLRLKIGASRLRDPWGNPLENPDAAGCDRLAVTNGFARAVRHFGPTALSRDVRARSLSLVPDGGERSRLTVQVVSRGGNAPERVDYAWYGPCDGLVTGACEQALAYGVPCEFSGLTPGMRTVWDSASGVARSVRIRPGDNHLQIEVP